MAEMMDRIEELVGKWRGKPRGTVPDGVKMLAWLLDEYKALSERSDQNWLDTLKSKADASDAIQACRDAYEDLDHYSKVLHERYTRFLSKYEPFFERIDGPKT